MLGGLISTLKSPRILLVDNHAMFRAGLCLLITSAWPEAQLLEAGSLEQALYQGLARVQRLAAGTWSGVAHIAGENSSLTTFPKRGD